MTEHTEQIHIEDAIEDAKTAEHVNGANANGSSANGSHGPAEGQEKASEGSSRSKRHGSPRPVRDLPNGFGVDTSGSIHRSVVNKDGDLEWRWVCSEINFIGMVHNESGTGCGILLEVRGITGKCHPIVIGLDMLSSDATQWWKDLRSLGLRVPPGKRAREDLLQLLTMYDSKERVLAVGKLGWHGNSYLRPDGVLKRTAKDQEIILNRGKPSNAEIGTKGTLEGWHQEIGRYVVGNSRLVSAICAALAGTMLTPLNLEGCGLHYRADSSEGKTLTLRVAASTAGPQSLVGTWNNTRNAIEGKAVLYNDGVMLLDELGEYPGNDPGSVAYSLINGSNRGRMNQDATLKEQINWKLFFLSTGEVDLSVKMNEGARKGGQQVRAGHEIRMLDVPGKVSEHGCFETIHDFEDSLAFVTHIEQASNEHYGHILKAWQEYLVKNPDWRKTAPKAIDRLARKLAGPNASGQVKRASKRFALLAYAGEVAIHAKILRWKKGEALAGITKIFNDWLEARGTVGPKEYQYALNAIRGCIQKHGSRFRQWDGKEPVRDELGLYRKSSAGRMFYIYPEALKNEILIGKDATSVMRWMIDNGYAQEPQKSQVKKTPYRLEKLPESATGKKTRMAVFLPTILSEDDGADDDDFPDSDSVNPNGDAEGGFEV